MKERDNIESIVIPVMYNFNFKNPSQVICRGILAPKICRITKPVAFSQSRGKAAEWCGAEAWFGAASGAKPGP